MNKTYDYLVKFPNNFQLADLFAFASSHGFQVRYVPTDPTRRQHPRQYEAVPVERGEPDRRAEMDRGEPTCSADQREDTNDQGGLA